MTGVASDLPPVLVLRILVPFALGYLLSFAYRVINAVIGADLSADLALDPAVLGMLTSTYFLTFAAFQLPLGVLLDRFGPRRTESLLLLFAAAGALLFARAESVAGLAAGRALIGLGVSACLMAAFKAYVEWFPKERLPLVNGIQMAAGGLGALTATRPVELLLTVTDWRGVFVGLSAATLLVSVLIVSVVPERRRRPAAGEGGGLGLGTVFRSPVFWRIAPWATCSQATFLSIQGLWAGTWLRDVAGLDRAGAANVLAAMTVAMIAGFLGLGGIAARLARAGIDTATSATVGMTLFMIPQALIIVAGESAPYWLWAVFGFLGTATVLSYSVLSQAFPEALTGRVNTSLNLLVFVSAFAAQWGLGAVIDRWTAGGAAAAHGYGAAFTLMLLLQVAGMAVFLRAGRRWAAMRRGARP